MKKHVLAFVVIAVGLAACATMTMKSVTAAPGFNPSQIHRVLVAAISPDEVLRRAVEDEFVRQWRERGVEAVSSYKVLASSVTWTKARVAPVARAGRFDAVLVARMMGEEKIDPKIRGEEFELADSTAPGLSEYTDAIVLSPEYAANYEMATLRANLYDTVSEKRVWSGATQALVAQNGLKLVDKYVSLILKTLYAPAKKL